MRPEIFVQCDFHIQLFLRDVAMLERKFLVDELDGEDLRVTWYSAFLDA